MTTLFLLFQASLCFLSGSVFKRQHPRYTPSGHVCPRTSVFGEGCCCFFVFFLFFLFFLGGAQMHVFDRCDQVTCVGPKHLDVMLFDDIIIFNVFDFGSFVIVVYSNHTLDILGGCQCSVPPTPPTSSSLQVHAGN